DARPPVTVAQPLRVAAGALAGQLEDARVHLAHDADQPSHLVPGGQTAGHGPPVGRLVARRAGSGEADGAGADRVAQLALHGSEIVLAGFLLERALAHDVGAERRVADVPRVVGAVGKALYAIEELGERPPRPVDAGVHRLGGDVLGALE